MSSNNGRIRQSINEAVATAAISTILSNRTQHHNHPQHEFYYDEQQHDPQYHPTNIPPQYYIYTLIQQIIEWIRHLLRLFLILCTMFLLSLVIYVIVYNAVIPEIISKPIYFDYNYQHCQSSSSSSSSSHKNHDDLLINRNNIQGLVVPCPPTAIIHLPSIHTQWEAHSPNVAPKTSSSSFVLPIVSSSLSSSKVTSKRRPYFIHIKLSLPSSYQNQQIGNFMIETYIQNSNRTILATSKRPVIIPYQSEYVSQWTNFLNLFFFVIGMKDENHILKIECFDHFMNGGGGGAMGSSGFGTSSSTSGRHYQYGMNNSRSRSIGQQLSMLGYYLSSNEATATEDDNYDDENHHYQQDHNHDEDDKEEELDTFMSYVEIRLLVPSSIHTTGVTPQYKPTTMSTCENERQCHDEKSTFSQINEGRRRNLNIHNHMHQNHHHHHHHASIHNDHSSTTTHTSIQITKAELQIGQELNPIQLFMTNWFYTSAFSFIFLTMIGQFLIYIFVKLIWNFRNFQQWHQQRSSRNQDRYYDYPSKNPDATVYDNDNDDDLNESNDYINIEDLNQTTNERSTGTTSNDVRNEAFDDESSDQWIAFDDNENVPSSGDASEYEENQPKTYKNDVQEQEEEGLDSKECNTKSNSPQDGKNSGKTTVSSKKKKGHESKLSHDKTELRNNAPKGMTSSERKKVDKVMREDWEPYEIFTDLDDPD